ncbi:MAG: hypothetical protein HGA55_06680 [Methanoregulaceae archaeon]|nr:hypothetical protein [Methanoregulaceae archaeon]
MSRGRSPKKAIAEAKEYATSKGYQVIHSDRSGYPFDFMISREQRITLVRVRRFRYRGYDSECVRSHCRDEIKELRNCTVSGTRELWVRGPDRTWHRYRITADGIRRIGRWEVSYDHQPPEGDSHSPAGKGAL